MTPDITYRVQKLILYFLLHIFTGDKSKPQLSNWLEWFCGSPHIYRCKTSRWLVSIDFLHFKQYYRYGNTIAPDKALFFQQKVLTFFLILHKNISCRYSLEVPHCGTSNEYLQDMISWINKINIMWILSLICCYGIPRKVHSHGITE